MQNTNYIDYYLSSPQQRAKDFRKDSSYKNILKLALQGSIKANDVYQKTNVAEGKKERGRIIGTKMKNLVHWGFLVKTGQVDSLYRQEIFKLNESIRERIRLFTEE
ncbi:MAG: hypothetical protein HY429_03645 [Candidatus Levybacteria bacterium]|nr:hypothetical protein [Candidatus Levybacteria bacterium]